MVKAKHPASSATRSPLKSSSQQSIGNEQRERIISDLSVDQSLPANGTAESIPIVSNNHTHQQGNASKVTKKSSRPISKRLQTPVKTAAVAAVVEQKAIERAATLMAIEHTETQTIQHSKYMAVEHPASVNVPAQDISQGHATVSSPSSLSLKRKAAVADNDALNVLESEQQPADKVVVHEITEGNDENVQLKAIAKPRHKAPSKPETFPKPEVLSKFEALPKPSTITDRKIKTSTKVALLSPSTSVNAPHVAEIKTLPPSSNKDATLPAFKVPALPSVPSLKRSVAFLDLDSGFDSSPSPPALPSFDDLSGLSDAFPESFSAVQTEPSISVLREYVWMALKPGYRTRLASASPSSPMAVASPSDADLIALAAAPTADCIAKSNDITKSPSNPSSKKLSILVTSDATAACKGKARSKSRVAATRRQPARKCRQNKKSTYGDDNFMLEDVDMNKAPVEAAIKGRGRGRGANKDKGKAKAV
ncbi:hypothetical protein G6F42_016044 [Rhizopus arrhizus]|nr:hypothetical protein G6F42_016044 [Rhizopus arrhizus]